MNPTGATPAGLPSFMSWATTDTNIQHPTPTSRTAAWAQTSTRLQFLVQHLIMKSISCYGERSEGDSKQSPGKHFTCTGGKKGDIVGGKEAGRMVGRESEGRPIYKEVTQCVERHKEAKMRVLEEVIQSDV